MTEQRLQDILAGFGRARVLVVGDFFLDKYLVMDAALTEESIETGLDAYQVVEKRIAPGAAGNVCANLAALGAGHIQALGIIGQDGEGFELRNCLHALGVDTESLLPMLDCQTPTYTKPMLRTQGVERELHRLDMKNHAPISAKAEAMLLTQLRRTVPQVDAVVVGDQVQLRNSGVVTDVVREELCRLAQRHPHVFFLADSRERIDEFRQMWIKPNRHEALRACGQSAQAMLAIPELVAAGRALAARNGRPVFMTLAEDGILSIHDQISLVPTLPQAGPIDICGAGDSTMASLVLALCSGARPDEAAMLGNIVASITVQQIGVTGKASQAQVLARFRAAGAQFQPRCLELIPS